MNENARIPVVDDDAEQPSATSPMVQAADREALEAATGPEREGQTRYRSLFEGAPLGIFRTTLEGRFLDVNPALVDLLGYPDRESLLATNAVATYVDPSERERLLAQVDREGGVRHAEIQTRRYDGTLIWTRDTVRAIRHADGRVLCYEGASEDISERKRAEEALRRRAEEMAALQATVLDITTLHDLPTLLRTIVERAALLLNTTGGGLYVCDPERREVRCVVSYRTPRDYSGTVLGYGEGAAGMVAQTGRPLLIDDYRTWSGRAAVYEEERPFAAVLSVPMIWRGQVTGVIHVLHDEARHFTPADQELLSLFADHAAIAVENARLYEETRREIADRKRAEAAETLHREALRESERKFRSVIEQAADGIVLADEEGTIIEWNEGQEQITGLKRADALGRPIWDVLFQVLSDEQKTPAVHERLRANTLEFLSTGQAPWLNQLQETEVQHPDETRRNVQALMFSIQTDKGFMSGSISRDITERRRTEEALRESEERYHAIFEQAADSIVLIDGETGALVEFNERAHQSLGYTQEEFAKLKIPDFEVIESAEEVAKHIEKIIREGADAFETKQRTKGGEIRNIQVSARAISIRGRRFVQSMWRDITERKQAEAAEALHREALRRRAAQLALLNDIGSQIAAALELESVLDRAARLVQERFGYQHVAVFTVDRPRGEVVMQARAGDFSHLFPPDHRLTLDQGVVGWVARHGETLLANDVRAEPRYVNLYPGLIPTRSELSVPVRLGGETVGVLDVQSPQVNAFDENDVLVMETLADQIAVAVKNARLYEALRENEERFRQMFENMSSAVAVYQALGDGEDFIFKDFNRAAEQIEHISRDKIINRSVREVFPGVEEFGLFAVFQRVWRTGQPEHHPINQYKDERIVGWRENYIYKLPSGEVVAIYDDLTDRKRAEEALRESERKLEQQERLAAVGQLAAGIAHDFNNLLTGIIGFAQLLQMRADVPAPVKSDLARIEREGQRAARLVRQILDFSRKSLRAPQLLDLALFLEESTGFLQRMIPENIHIVLDVTAGDYLVHADPTQIQQVLTNLATNARDAMPNGGALLVRLGRRTLLPTDPPPLPGMRPGDWVVWSVTDTGTGMTPEVMAHLFEPFFTTKEVGKGTGLGLAQVYGIVKQHDGYITAESQVGRGTTFTIYLPPARPKEEAVSVAHDMAPGGRGEAILVVEDEELVLEAIRRQLEGLGYRVLVAGSGAEALRVCEEHRGEIALVLTDLVMPGMSGLALIQALQVQEPRLKAAVITGYPLGGEEQLPLVQAAVPWILKPVDRAQLAQVVRLMLAS